MADRPLLIFPEPAMVVRSNKGSGAKNLTFPSGQRQAERIEPRIAELEEALAARRVELRQSPIGIEPEQVLVLETVGRVDDFFKALKDIQGLEWLGDIDADEIMHEDDDFYEASPSGGKGLSGRVYMVMSNQRGLEQLRGFWNAYKRKPDAPQYQFGYTKWRDLFKQLKDIRAWGPQDRLFETGLDQDWEERSALREEIVRVEVELWFRSDPGMRSRSVKAVETYIQAAAGELVGQSCIPEIAYHAVLARLPIQSVENIIAHKDATLVYCDQVMFLRPLGQAMVTLPDADHDAPATPPPEATTTPTGSPVVAVLDGMPLENHRLLANRLVVDDPDSWGSAYEAAERIHGTAMVSLVVHGDLELGGAPLGRPVYVRPIMKPDANDWNRPRRESVPEEVLPVDLVHRAVRRIFEGGHDMNAVAPDVNVINLSVCDLGRQFDRYLSAWARLIDYLSWHYKVMFVVSAGNHSSNIETAILKRDWALVKGDPEKIEAETLRAIVGEARNRRLYSPAESINALTVAAVHVDASAPVLPPTFIDPLGSSMPSPINAQGLGFRKSVKPDVLFPGGRVFYKESMRASGGNIALEATALKRAPGHRTATPGGPGDLNATCYSRGTSNAAALATHTAGKLHDMFSSLRDEPGGNILDERSYALLMKATIVHGASWGATADKLRTQLPSISEDSLSRLLGYGEVDTTRLFECTAERVTLIGCGKLGDKQAHRFELPLPPSLSGKTVWRRLTLSLAWFSPINPNHRNYRVADLWFTPYGAHKEDASAKNLLQARRRETDWQMARRGTTQHEVFEGHSATSYVDGQVLKVQVNCRSDAGQIVDDIPYALVASLEVAPGVSIPVYQEVRERVRQRVRPRVALGTNSGAVETP